MYGVYLWPNNTYHRVWKKCIYASKLRSSEWNSWVNFFMVYDIDIHELNLGPFKDLKFLDEISFKECVFSAFLDNKCIIISF